LFCFYANAGDIKYSVNAIPDSLKKGANVVKRAEELQFEISNMNEAVFRKKVVYTILNEKGDDKADMVVMYDRLRKITVFDGTLYDANGQQLKKVKNKDIKDYSAVQNNMLDDNRIKVYDFNYRVYPYTVEYEVEIKFNNTYIFPAWVPLSSEELSVEGSSYTLIVPLNYIVRHKAFNYKGQLRKTRK
jgi:hypothetical protein